MGSSLDTRAILDRHKASTHLRCTIRDILCSRFYSLLIVDGRIHISLEHGRIYLLFLVCEESSLDLAYSWSSSQNKLSVGSGLLAHLELATRKRHNFRFKSLLFPLIVSIVHAAMYTALLSALLLVCKIDTQCLVDLSSIFH